MKKIEHNLIKSQQKINEKSVASLKILNENIKRAIVIPIDKTGRKSVKKFYEWTFEYYFQASIWIQKENLLLTLGKRDDD